MLMAINEQTLQSFLSGNLSVLDEIIGTDASELKNILNSATLSGMAKSEILNQVSVASSASAQKAILNTRLNTYSRVATNTMMKDAPSDTKYVYVGPIDDRTRDECLEYASAGALTEAEIIGNGWTASLVDGGGINCRHKWEITSDEGIKLFEGKQAQQVIKNKPKPVYKPKPKPYNKDALYQAGKHKTIPDSKSWLKTNVGDKITLTNLKDLNIANELTDTLEGLFSTYKLKKLKRGIDGRASGQTMAAANGEVLSISKRALSRKALDNYYKTTNTNYMKDVREVVDSWKAKLAEFEKKGAYAYGRQIKWYRTNIRIYEKKLKTIDDFGFKRFVYTIEGNELTTIITHETGHILHDQFSGFVNRSLKKSSGVDTQYWNKRWTDIYRITANKKGKEVLLTNGKKSIATGEVGMISEYASANPMELFAESFSMYATGAADELPKIIKQYLDEYLTEIKDKM